MRPREIQARIRAGESVDQVAAAAGVPAQRIERFAYPVLLERSRTAQLAQQAHPVRSDGPDVRTLEEVITDTFSKRGLDYAAATWDSWRGENGKWVVQLHWQVGRSENKAHWTFHPGAHGGTVTAIDDHATDLIDPQAAAPLRPVAPVTPLTPAAEAAAAVPSWEPVPREQPPAPSPAPPPATPPADPQINVPVAEERHRAHEQHRARAVPDDGPAYRPSRGAERPVEGRPAEREDRPAKEPPPATPASPAKRSRKDRPIVPSWEDVRLGVRSPRE